MWKPVTFVVLFIQIFSQLCLSCSLAREKRSAPNEPHIPQTLSPQLQRMVHRGLSLEAFLSSVIKDGQPMNIQDVYPFESADSSTGEKTYISGGAKLAFPDECSPRLTSVHIPRSPNDPAQYVYWPECTQIARCGGCTPSDKLVCVPDEVVMEEYHVLRADVRDQGSLYLEWAGPLAVAIEKHVSCMIVCKLGPLDCEPYQRFIPEECTCVCNYRSECSSAQTWNSDTCECECPIWTHRNCPRNTVYDHRRCRCVISEEAQEANIAIGHDLSQAEIDQYLQIQNQTNSPTSTSTSTTTTTTPTPTTTTPTTTTHNDPCQIIRCPGNWRKVMRNGFCVCSPY